MYTVYTVHKYSIGLYVHTAVQSHTIWDESVDLLTLRKYTALNGTYVFDMRYVFQEHIPGVK